MTGDHYVWVGAGDRQEEVRNAAHDCERQVGRHAIADLNCFPIPLSSGQTYTCVEATDPW